MDHFSPIPFPHVPIPPDKRGLWLCIPYHTLAHILRNAVDCGSAWPSVSTQHYSKEHYSKERVLWGSIPRVFGLHPRKKWMVMRIFWSSPPSDTNKN